MASVAFCILLSINAADVNSRVLHLETGNGEHSFLRAPGYSMDDFNSLIGQRVDELLSQVKVALARATSVTVCALLLDKVTLFEKSFQV